ncbi:MAG: hypothetical protein DME19_09580 [Verrucomicrobia bacterium]|nr:MAG: hypothetical protein DME19_09580 [Verrucomicrobiota bacterium]
MAGAGETEAGFAHGVEMQRFKPLRRGQPAAGRLGGRRPDQDEAGHEYAEGGFHTRQFSHNLPLLEQKESGRGSVVGISQILAVS